MNTVQDAIRRALGFGRMTTTMVLGELSDENLLVRPVDGANHVAWQLGHLISSENMLMSGMPHADMPALPEGFAEKYTPETSKSDDKSGWETKERYVELYQQQRAATEDALEKTTGDELNQPGPEMVRAIAPTVGDVFNLMAAHELMHVGQYSVVRRKLGMKPAF